MTDRTLLSQEQIKDTQQLAAELAIGFTDRQLLTMMGMMNVYIKFVAQRHGVTQKDSIEIDLQKFYEMMNASAEGQVALTVASDWMSQYLKQYWPTSYWTENTIRKYRTILMQAGLFTYDAENRPKGAFWGALHGVPCQGIATPPELEQIDVARMLIFYQTFDRVIRERNLPEVAFEKIPSHGGMLVVRLYNALFNGERDFRGNLNRECDMVVPACSYEPIKTQIFWKWKRFFGMSRQQWQNLITRAGHVYEDVKKKIVQQDIEFAAT